MEYIESDVDSFFHRNLQNLFKVKLIHLYNLGIIFNGETCKTLLCNILANIDVKLCLFGKCTKK